MRTTTLIAALALLIGGLNLASAQDEQPAIPVPSDDAASAEPITLYPCVEVDDADEIAPCAEPLIVSVADPCNPCCCRHVQICVPKCGCPEITRSKCGTKVTYDYGKYSVEIKSKADVVEVEYDD